MRPSHSAPTIKNALKETTTKRGLTAHRGISPVERHTAPSIATFATSPERVS
jgi:hypothetical protein